MSKENPNNFHWKNKLEDVGSLSGETLNDKNATWEKLHDRLRQKPRRIRPVWYWAAAACLLLIVIIPLMRDNKKQDSLVKNIPKQILPKKIPAIKNSLLKENVVADISPSLIEMKKIEPAIQIKNKKSPENNIVKKEETVLANFNKQKNIEQQPTISPPAVINSSAATSLAVVPVIKKLKVVHINELGDPGIEFSNTARYYERHSFQLKLINQEVYTSSTLPSNSTGFNIFKTKNAPSN